MVTSVFPNGNSGSVERGFNILTRKAIRRGSFSPIIQLKEKILHFIDPCNASA